MSTETLPDQARRNFRPPHGNKQSLAVTNGIQRRPAVTSAPERL